MSERCPGCTAGWPVEWDRWHWPYRLIHRAPDDQWAWCPCTKEQGATGVDAEVAR